MKLVLDTKDLTDGFFEETKLLGIMAPIKDYQFCWHLNNLLGIDFRINNELEIQLKKKERNYFFAVYEYQIPAITVCHYLYNNQFDGEYLLPEFKHLDFLWMIKGELIADDELKALILSIRAIAGVQLISEMSSDKIRNKQHLIF